MEVTNTIECLKMKTKISTSPTESIRIAVILILIILAATFTYSVHDLHLTAYALGNQAAIIPLLPPSYNYNSAS